MSKKGCKRGARSDNETDLLHKYIENGKSIEEIAKALNRNVSTIEKWMEELHLEVLGKNPSDVRKILDTLHKMHFWPEICKQFNQEEIRYFEGEWVQLILQFQQDGVLAAELLSLRQLVTINILINRCMKERMKHNLEIEKLQAELNEEYKTQFSPDRIAFLEQQISMARSAMTQYTSEYTKLLDQQKTINKDLKATRDQRIKRIEDSKTSFAGWLRILEDKDYRERIGIEAEIMKIAKDKAHEKMNEYHTYINGEVDRPFLIPEDIEKESTEEL